MLWFAFFAMAVLHFGGFVILPLWLVFAPLGIIFAILVLAWAALGVGIRKS